jgi:HSP20 family molecular chaperone IbpA
LTIKVFKRDGNVVVRAELPGPSQDAVKAEATVEGLVPRGERK